MSWPSSEPLDERRRGGYAARDGCRGIARTPAAIVERYATLAQRAETRSFGLIEDDVIVLDTETTGLDAPRIAS